MDTRQRAGTWCGKEQDWNIFQLLSHHKAFADVSLRDWAPEAPRPQLVALFTGFHFTSWLYYVASMNYIFWQVHPDNAIRMLHHLEIVPGSFNAVFAAFDLNHKKHLFIKAQWWILKSTSWWAHSVITARLLLSANMTLSVKDNFCSWCRMKEQRGKQHTPVGLDETLFSFVSS